MEDEVQCDSCDNCKEVIIDIVHCTSYEIAVGEGLVTVYEGRQEGGGTGFVVIDIPTNPCKWHSNPKPTVPEGKLIHSPANWGQYRKVKQ